MGQIDMTLSSTSVTLVNGKASVTATVRNGGVTPERVVVRTYGGTTAAAVPADPSPATGSPPDPPSWVTVADSPREVGPGATEQFLLAVDTAAAGAVPGGTYAVKVNAYSAEEPPEANSGPVLDLQITVPPTQAPAKQGWFRWWMAAAAAVLVAVVLVVAFLLWPRGVEVPDVVGKPLAEAAEIMQTADLTFTPLPVASDQPEGTVIEQDPAAGTPVDQEATVTLSVAVPRTVTVPDTVGSTAATARNELESLELVPLFGTTGALCSTGSTCRVQFQSLEPGIDVPVNTQIQLAATVVGGGGGPTARPTRTFPFPTEAFPCRNCSPNIPWGEQVNPREVERIPDLTESWRFDQQ